MSGQNECCADRAGPVVRRNVGPPQFVCLKGGGGKGTVMLALSVTFGSHLEFPHWYIEVRGAEAHNVWTKAIFC